MIQQQKLHNSFEYLEIENRYAKAKVALQGAHLFYYQNKKSKHPLLWLSESAYFEKHKAIRGGVPICFPWFGKLKEKPDLPQHGFARVSLWELVKQEERADGGTVIILELRSNEERFKLWAYHFKVQLEIVVAEVLEIRLRIENIDSKAFEITTALHSYFWVSDVTRVEIRGLKERRYYDALDGQFYQQNEEIKIHEEIDRVYFDPQNPLRLIDQNRALRLESRGSKSLVLWNPWIEKSKAMQDMDNEGYHNMLCLESSNTMEDRQTLQPNQTHTLELIVTEHHL